MQLLYHFHLQRALRSSPQTPVSASVWMGRGCDTNYLLQRAHNRKSNRALFLTWPIAVLDPLTCWVLRADRTPIKGRTISGNGPNLAGSPDGDRLERLVGSHMEPGRALEGNHQVTTMLEKSLFILKMTIPQSVWHNAHKVLQVLQFGTSVLQWTRLTAGVSEETPSRHSTSPLLLMAHRGTTSTLLWAAHGRMLTSLSAIGETSCQGPVVVSLHFLGSRKNMVNRHV